jgi:hypothetical protein
MPELYSNTVEANKFLVALLAMIGSVALSSRWKPPEKKLGDAYCVSLVNGDGTVPNGLSAGKQHIIQQRFIKLCHDKNVTGLPGQGQPWYK